ncbi:MAG: ADP-ribosylglycohydrolase family protein, partial [Sinobacterium sp.]|nr:ADP-ribosylglycohydrolase family protein [Sinobacterium sp.]
VYANFIYRAINGESKADILKPMPVPEFYEYPEWHDDIQAVISGSYRNKTESEIHGSGFVVQSLEAALWCFYNSNDFKTGALMAANLGEDADTTAAIYGQLAGAFYGADAIPQAWLDKLYLKDEISEMARNLF